MLLVGALLLAQLWSCSESGPFLIGFAGPLEGKYSDLGVQGRNGAQLAIELENTRGGINGRKLKLIAQHDGYSAEEAQVAIQALKESGVKVVIGHMTSAQSMASYDLAEKLKLPRISPTTSTPLLSHREDLFFRVISSSRDWANGLATYCRTVDKTRTVVTLQDRDNEAYSLPFNQIFEKRFIALGGTVLDQIDIRSSSIKDWNDIAKRIASSGAEALTVALSARDLAALARQLRVQNIDIPIYSSMWAYTRELTLAGGKAVEGIIFAVSYTGDNKRSEFTNFQVHYQERFGWPPNYAAAFGFEAASVLIEALRWGGGDPSLLSESIMAMGNHPGVSGPIRFDEFGDVIRPSFIVTIRDRTFVTLTTIEND